MGAPASGLSVYVREPLVQYTHTRQWIRGPDVEMLNGASFLSRFVVWASQHTARDTKV